MATTIGGITHMQFIYQSDTGFSVDAKPNYFPGMLFIYRDNGKTMNIYGERLVSPHGVLVPPNFKKAKWELPHVDEPISLAEYIRILWNLKEAINSQNQPVDFGRPITKAQLELYRILQPDTIHPTFSIPTPNICECSDGYSVEFNGPLYVVVYRAEGKVLCVPCTYQVTLFSLEFQFVNGMDLHWEPPHDHEVISDYIEELHVIHGNISRSMFYMKSEGCWPPPLNDLTPSTPEVAPHNTKLIFSIPRPNVCECTAGFSVEFVVESPTYTTIYYREGEKVLRLAGEIRLRGVAHKKWNKTWDDHEPLDLQRKVTIHNHIIEALIYMNSKDCWPPT